MNIWLLERDVRFVYRAMEEVSFAQSISEKSQK